MLSLKWNENFSGKWDDIFSGKLNGLFLCDPCDKVEILAHQSTRPIVKLMTD